MEPSPEKLDEEGSTPSVYPDIQVPLDDQPVDPVVQEVHAQERRAMFRFPQPEPMKAYLIDRLNSDSYNKYCVDCNRQEATHASTTFGIFICGDCAEAHRQLGMNQSYIKNLSEELWDEYQLKSIDKNVGGNKKWYDLLKEYQIQTQPINKKYTSAIARWYRGKLMADVCHTGYSVDKPAKNWQERGDKVVEKVGVVADKAEAGIMKFGNALDRKLTEKGWKDKINNVFKKKPAEEAKHEDDQYDE